MLPPLSNGWMMNKVWLYIALNRTPNIDCYWEGAVPKVLGWDDQILNFLLLSNIACNLQETAPFEPYSRSRPKGSRNWNPPRISEFSVGFRV